MRRNINRPALVVFVMMTATVMLFESYVIVHSRAVSERGFTSWLDGALFLICPALPFLLLLFFARRRGTERYQGVRALSATIAAGLTLAVSSCYLIALIRPIAWGMDQGTATLYVVLLPLAAVPGAAICSGVAYILFAGWKRRHAGQTSAE